MKLTYYLTQFFKYLGNQLVLILDSLNFNNLFRDENFRIVDIEINAWSPLFINLKINLIFNLYPEIQVSTNHSVDCRIRTSE